MTTDVFVTRVKPDPRGRLALSKAIEAVNRLLHTAVSGFDVLLQADGSLMLRPMVEVPANQAIKLSTQEWEKFSELMNKPQGVNAALQKAVRSHQTAIIAGEVVSGRSRAGKSVAPEQPDTPDHLQVPQAHRAPQLSKKIRKNPYKK